jgi:hypothetical protein
MRVSPFGSSVRVGLARNTKTRGMEAERTTSPWNFEMPSESIRGIDASKIASTWILYLGSERKSVHRPQMDELTVGNMNIFIGRPVPLLHTVGADRPD